MTKIEITTASEGYVLRIKNSKNEFEDEIYAINNTHGYNSEISESRNLIDMFNIISSEVSSSKGKYSQVRVSSIAVPGWDFIPTEFDKEYYDYITDSIGDITDYLARLKEVRKQLNDLKNKKGDTK